MITESYNYIALANKTYYYFESEGKQGKIPKLIIFTYLGRSYWNLAFGDMHNSGINDSVISNNHDIVKIFGTIAKVIYDFSDEFPKRHIRIKPVDEKRRSLYNHIFRRNHNTISATFKIIGINNKRKEPYSSKKTYEYFELKRKFAQ